MSMWLQSKTRQGFYFIVSNVTRLANNANRRRRTTTTTKTTLLIMLFAVSYIYAKTLKHIYRERKAMSEQITYTVQNPTRSNYKPWLWIGSQTRQCREQALDFTLSNFRKTMLEKQKRRRGPRRQRRASRRGGQRCRDWRRSGSMRSFECSFDPDATTSFGGRALGVGAWEGRGAVKYSGLIVFFFKFIINVQ